MALRFVTMAELDIPTAGTAVQVSASAIPVSTVIFQADPANTGAVYVGDSAVAATRGIVLNPGDITSISADRLGQTGQELRLSDFYVDAATNGNDVRVSYIKSR